MSLSKLFYNPREKSNMVCQWDWVLGAWKCAGGHPYRRTQARSLERLRSELGKAGFQETV